MSNAEPEPSASERVAEDPKAAPENAGCTLGTSLLLGFILLSVAGSFALKPLSAFLAKDLDLQTALEASFKSGSIPFGLMEAGAKEFVGRAEVLRFVEPGLDARRAQQELAWKAAKQEAKRRAAERKRSGQDMDELGTAAEDPDAPKALEELVAEPGSLAPEELLLVSFEKVKDLIKLFATNSAGFGAFGKSESDADVSRKLEAWKKNASYDWKTTRTRDKLQWDGWEADFHIERSFHTGGLWQDRAKINLGLGKRNLALFATWAPGYSVTRADLLRVALCLRMDFELPGVGLPPGE